MYFVRMTWYYLSLSNYYLNYTYNHIQIYTCTYIYTCRDNSNTQLNIHLWFMSAKKEKPCDVEKKLQTMFGSTYELPGFTKSAILYRDGIQ